MTRTVVVRRAFPALIEDVWDASTTAERISHWFIWVMGEGPASEVEVRLSPGTKYGPGAVGVGWDLGCSACSCT